MDVKITDKQRREVAARLRELPSDTYAALKELEEGGLFIEASIGDEADYNQIHNAILGCFPAEYMHPGDYEELHNRLADLVDRPTCHDVGGGYEFRCSACGCVIHIFRDGGFFGDDDSAMTIGGDSLYVPHYCPNCGAEVVE